MAQVDAFLAFAADQGMESALAQINVVVKEDPIRDVLTRLYQSVIPAYAEIERQEILDRYKNELTQEKLFGVKDTWLRSVTNFILNFSSKKIVEISETTRENIRNTISRELANGESYGRMAQAIRITPIYAYRSRVIARTEVTGAANYAANEGAKRTGLAMKKVWISDQTDRTRHLPRDRFDHLNANGQTVDMNESFLIQSKFGVEPLAYPGDPNGSAANIISCRCGVGHEAKRDANGRLIRVPIYE